MAENKKYDFAYFRAPNEYLARRVVLPDLDGVSSEERWEKETPLIFSLMCREMLLQKGQLVVDYGCGTGRLSKMLCDNGCKVIGVDSSSDMRAFAVSYVNSPDNFLALSPETFDSLVNNGLRCSAVIAIRVFQHSPDPGRDFQRIDQVLKHAGRLFILNNRMEREVPVEGGPFLNDGVDIWRLADMFFGNVNTTPFPMNLGVKAERWLFRTYLKTTSTKV